MNRSDFESTLCASSIRKYTLQQMVNMMTTVKIFTGTQQWHLSKQNFCITSFISVRSAVVIQLRMPGQHKAKCHPRRQKIPSHQKEINLLRTSNVRIINNNGSLHTMMKSSTAPKAVLFTLLHNMEVHFWYAVHAGACKTHTTLYV
jgi:hypothetical protein